MLLLGQTVAECKAKALADVRELKWNPKQAVVAIAEEAQSYSAVQDLLVAPPLDRQLFTVVAGNSEVFV